MSPSERIRSDWSSVTWFLLLLCLSLVGWRFNVRQEQYRASTTNSSISVSAFDANERNYKSAHATPSQSRVVTEASDRLYAITGTFEPPTKPVLLHDTEPRVALGFAFVYSISLFSNPPPPSLG